MRGCPFIIVGHLLIVDINRMIPSVCLNICVTRLVAINISYAKVVTIIVTGISMAIKSFRHKGLEDFFYDGTSKGINPKHETKLATRLDFLDAAIKPEDMNLPGYRLHKLEPRNKNRWAITVSGAWRLTFEFEDNDAVVVDYEQYH